MQIPIIFVIFFGQRRLEVKAAISVIRFNEQIGCEVNGVRFSIKKLVGAISGTAMTVR